MLHARLSRYTALISIASAPADQPKACVVSHVLEAEPTIRIIVTACRLAASLRRISDPISGEAPSPLPVFDFWLSSLRAALDEDSFWGPNIWKELEPRASNLENGIHEMVSQCIEFEGIQTPKTVGQPVGGPEPLAQSGTYRSDDKATAFVSEESSWMQKILVGCWTTVLADTAHVPAIVTNFHPSANLSLLSRPLSS